MVTVTVTFPLCFQVWRVVFPSTRVKATVSPYGLSPVAGLSLPSYLPLYSQCAPRGNHLRHLL